MSLRDIARLLVKFAGLIVIVNALINFPSLWVRALEYTGKNPVSFFQISTMSVAPTLVSLGAGLLMYWGSDRVTDRFLVDKAHGIDENNFRAIEEIALAIFGIYQLTNGIADEVYFLARYNVYHKFSGLNPNYSAITQSEFAGICIGWVRIVIGVALFSLSRGVATLRRRILSLRSLGRDANGDDI